MQGLQFLIFVPTSFSETDFSTISINWKRLSLALGGEHRAEPVPPKPHRLVADIDTPFMQ